MSNTSNQLLQLLENPLQQLQHLVNGLGPGLCRKATELPEMNAASGKGKEPIHWKKQVRDNHGRFNAMVADADVEGENLPSTSSFVRKTRAINLTKKAIIESDDSDASSGSLFNVNGGAIKKRGPGRPRKATTKAAKAAKKPVVFLTGGVRTRSWRKSEALKKIVSYHEMLHVNYYTLVKEVLAETDRAFSAYADLLNRMLGVNDKLRNEVHTLRLICGQVPEITID